MPKLFHIPVCPFSQRIEILLRLKGLDDAVSFEEVDITVPRDPAFLARTRGDSRLPVLVLDDGRLLRESLVLMQYLEDCHPERPVAQRDPWRRAVENMLTRLEGPFVDTGYGFVMNQDASQREPLHQRMLSLHADLDAFLVEHAPDQEFLWESFGWAEVVFTPIFVRFWFLEYYEGFDLPEEPRFARVRRWREACLGHPAAQQVTREEIVKLYYDYAKGLGNGALVPGRKRSSFVRTPPASSRPWPPPDKYGVSASDEDLGLL